MRILSLHPATTELAFAIGAGNMLVGRCDACKYPEAALNVPSIGNANEVTTDKVAIFEPDVVLIGPGQTSFPAYQTVLVAPESLQEIYAAITALGVLFGKDVEADILVHDLQNLFEKIRVKAARFKSVTIGVAGNAPAYVQDLVVLGAGEVVPLENQPHLLLVVGSEEDAELFIAQHPELKAVQNERVFSIDAQLLYATPRLIEGAKILAKILHGIEVNG